MVFYSNGYFIVPFAIQRIGEAMISVQSMAGVITPFPGRAGSAPPLHGLFRQMTRATVAVLVGYFADGTSLPMATAFLFAGITPVGIYIYFIKEIS